MNGLSRSISLPGMPFTIVEWLACINVLCSYSNSYCYDVVLDSYTYKAAASCRLGNNHDTEQLSHTHIQQDWLLRINYLGVQLLLS